MKPTLADQAADAALSLAARGARTLLTLAGIVVGLGALVAISGVTASMAENVVRTFDQYAATQISLSGPRAAMTGLSDDDLDQIRTVPGVEGVALVCHLGPRPIDSPFGTSSTETEVIGMSMDSLAVVEPTISPGAGISTLTALEHQRVALVGVGIAEHLNLGDPASGTSVTLDGLTFSVAGVISDIPRLPHALNQVIVPLDALTASWPGGCATGEIIITTDPDQTSAIASVAREAITPDRVGLWTVAVPPSPDSLRASVTADLSGLYIISGMSLIVGALSVGNTMSVSVLERRAEIGLRRALGYSQRGIFTLFCIEALIIGTIGGMIGSSCGSLTVIAIALISGMPVVLWPPIVLGTPLLGGIIGLLGGIAPALQAARLSPASALRGSRPPTASLARRLEVQVGRRRRHALAEAELR